MNVYIVMSGEYNEGGLLVVEKAFRTLDSALRVAHDFVNTSFSVPMTQDGDVPKLSVVRRWQGGRDWVEIVKIPVVE